MNDEVSTVIEFDEDISLAEQPEPLPKGDYSFTIVGAEPRVSGNSGNTYAAITMQISPDDFPADYPVENAPDGVRLIYRRVVLENERNARYRLRKFCEAIGAPMSTRMDLNDWLGLRGVCTVDHESYEGEMRAQVVRVKAE